MAVKGYIDTQLNALAQEMRYPLQQAFHYLMDNWRIGTAPRAENAQFYRVSSTSHATANAEFSVSHGLGVIPSQLIQILDLSLVGSQIVPLQVSRAPDAQRIYLKSSSTSAVMTLMIEP